jgi:hypothetical protein
VKELQKEATHVGKANGAGALKVRVA